MKKNVNCSIQMFLGLRIIGHSSVVKAACLESRRLLVWPPLWHSNSKEQNVSSPLTRKDSIFWGKVSIAGSLRDREVVCSASDRHGRILNPVSGGLCHLIHLTILRRCSWLCLAYRAYVHKGGLKHHSFNFKVDADVLEVVTNERKNIIIITVPWKCWF